MQRALLGAILCAAAPAAAAQADTVVSTRHGVYSEAQARRGESVFRRECERCHLPDFFQETILPSWTGASVATLYNAIRTQMPEDRPGGLPPRQYADVLAYIFELNGLPPGPDDLPSDVALLRRILIERSR